MYHSSEAQKKVRVLIVDDSAVARSALADVLSGHPSIEVAGMASDPFEAAEFIRKEVPAVMVLDIEMPKMNGIVFLRKVMQQHPIPTVICSSRADEGSKAAMAALEAGAIELVKKPAVGTREFLEASKERICDAVLAAAAARMRHLPRAGHVEPLHNGHHDLSHNGQLEAQKSNGSPNGASARHGREAHTPPAAKTRAPSNGSKQEATPHPTRAPLVRAPFHTTLIAVGASTGGTEAIFQVLKELPESTPGIVIVQHMPEHFTASFASWLNERCRIEVAEAQDGDLVLPGKALIAPGGQHMLLERAQGRFCVRLSKAPPVSRHRPSVNVLFHSVASQAGKNCIGVILTGMGDDGADGMLAMKQSGATTIAQDEDSCVVFGMPKEAIKRGGVDHVMSLTSIPSALVKLYGG